MNLVKAEDYGLEVKQATEITKGLSTILEERVILIDAYKDVISLEISQENLSTFKALRLQIRDNRTKGIEKWHKTNKAYFLTGGRFVDAIKNKEVVENERMESKLMDAEKHFENLEKERVEKIQFDRINLISEYIEDAHLIDLSGMEEDVWDAYLSTKKKSYVDRVQAELDAEKERLLKIKAEKEEQIRIQKENERLLLEAKERERLDEIKVEKRDKRNKELQPYIVFIRDYNRMIELSDSEYKKEFTDIKKGAEDHWEYERKEQLRKAKEEEDRQLREVQEREKRLKLEAELKAKQDAEQKAKEVIDAKIQSELSKGDTAKVKDLIADLNALKTKYAFKSAKNKKMYADVGSLIEKIANHIHN
jgi:hypothetical protein